MPHIAVKVNMLIDIDVELVSEYTHIFIHRERQTKNINNR